MSPEKIPSTPEHTVNSQNENHFVVPGHASVFSHLHIDDHDVTHRHDYREIFHPEYTGDTQFSRPPFAFAPDEWTKAFQHGLAAIDVDGKDVCEVGVGIGPNAAFLLHDRNPRQMVISDLRGKVTEVALENLKRVLPPEKFQKLLAIRGDQSLLTAFTRENDQFHYILACIPQVKRPPNIDLSKDDNSAHYFDEDELHLSQSDLHDYQLDLLDEFLAQASGKFRNEKHRRSPLLVPGGKTILNLGGRPGTTILDYLHRKNGFEPRIIHHEVIRQHPDTDLSPFAEIEKRTKIHFEFFSDANATTRLSASEAEDHRQKKQDLYHRIYVYEGTLPETSPN